MDIRGAGRNRTMLLMVLIGIGSFSRQILELQIEIKELFVMRIATISFLLFSVMYYSPGLFSSDGIWAQRLGGWFNLATFRTWAFLFIGLTIAGGALFQEVEGSQGLQGIILLTALFSAASFGIAFSMAILARNLIGGGKDDHLETNNFDWGLTLIGEALEEEQRYLGGKSLLLAKRVRRIFLEEITNDTEIGRLVSDRDHEKDWGVVHEINDFCRRKVDTIQRMMYERDEISIVSTERSRVLTKSNCNKYVRANLKSEFEGRLLNNLSKRANGGNDVFARNLIQMFPGTYRRMFKPKYEKKIMKRQMILFMHLFSDIFRIGVSNRGMSVEVAKMHLDAIMEFLYENDDAHPERGDHAQWELKDIRIAGEGPDSIPSNVASASRVLASSLESLAFGLERLDMKKTEGKTEDGFGDVDSPLRDFSESCWSYFRGSEA